jgi:drug/metabolite transporter (DMT)-like permease
VRRPRHPFLPRRRCTISLTGAETAHAPPRSDALYAAGRHAVIYLNASIAAILNATVPLFTTIASTLWLKERLGFRNVGPTKTSTVTFLIPLFGILWARAFLGEPTSLGMFAGLGVILASVWLVLTENRNEAA